MVRASRALRSDEEISSWSRSVYSESDQLSTRRGERAEALTCYAESLQILGIESLHLPLELFEFYSFLFVGARGGRKRGDEVFELLGFPEEVRDELALVGCGRAAEGQWWSQARVGCVGLRQSSSEKQRRAGRASTAAISSPLKRSDSWDER